MTMIEPDKATPYNELVNAKVERVVYDLAAEHTALIKPEEKVYEPDGDYISDDVADNNELAAEHNAALDAQHRAYEAYMALPATFTNRELQMIRDTHAKLEWIAQTIEANLTPVMEKLKNAAGMFGIEL